MALSKVTLARTLRQKPTVAERALWRILRSGALVALNWRKQAPFRNYVLDFASHPARLVVEADGSQHSEPSQRGHDEKRSALLEAEGYRVLRFWNNDIFSNADGVFRVVMDAACATPARARIERWKRDRQTSPSMGEVAERSEAGGGVSSRASMSDSGGAPPQSALRVDSSPIEGELSPRGHRS